MRRQVSNSVLTGQRIKSPHERGIMTKYSITRLNCYRECPYKYKLKYIDEIEDPFQSTDATFLGSMCHEALEKMYKEKMNGTILSESELLSLYNASWKEKYDPKIIKHIDNRYSSEYYRLQGEGMLSRFYQNVFSNDDMQVLGVETKDLLELPDGNQYYVRIDRLSYKEGIYYICDYKTDKAPKEQSEADAD